MFVVEALAAALHIEARRLRAEDGLSLGEISRRLGIAPATARRWTLDISLTRDQLAGIDAQRAAAARAASAAMAEDRRRQRLAWQLEGRVRAKAGDPLHQAGCLLYWAEGAKARNSVILANSDPHLMRLFCRFLSDCFELGAADLTLRLHLYTGNGLTIRQVEDRWLRYLGLPRSCLRGHSINNRPAPSSGRKRNKLPYGVGNLRVRRSTWLAQHIFGAIQEYGEFDEPRWLD